MIVSSASNWVIDTSPQKLDLQTSQRTRQGGPVFPSRPVKSRQYVKSGSAGLDDVAVVSMRLLKIIVL